MKRQYGLRVSIETFTVDEYGNTSEYEELQVESLGPVFEDQGLAEEYFRSVLNRPPFAVD